MVGYNILPIGFSSYEKSTIETFFRLAGRRAPHWGLTARSSEARVVLFNATSQQDIESFRSLVAPWQKVILVGGSDFGTGWPVLPRPIKLTAILGMLDALVTVEVVTQQAQAAPTTPAAATAPNVPFAAVLPAAVAVKPSMTDVFASMTNKIEPAAAPVSIPAQAAVPVPVPVPVPVGEVRGVATGISNVEQMTRGKIVTHSVPSAVIGRVLIVDDSDIALKYMQNRLRHFGYECELVRSGEEALTMVGKHNYQFVFLDVMMAGLDGYQTCKAIKNNKARRGPAPVVVMLTSRGGTIDKIRGSMAGCDAYLTKPLNDNRLGAVLAKFDETTIRQRWEAANPQQPLVDTYSPRSR
jgi:two-component system, cell cycle response regulator